MIFMFDNNFPKPLAYALRELSAGQYKEHKVIHLQDDFAQNAPDKEWIAALSHEKQGACVLTRDKLNKGIEADLLSNSGLIVFFFGKSWMTHKFWDISQHMVRWWPRIVEQAEGVSKGALFEVPWRFQGKGQFIQIKRR